MARREADLRRAVRIFIARGLARWHDRPALRTRRHQPVRANRLHPLLPGMAGRAACARALNSDKMASNLAPGGVSLIGDLAQSSGIREALQWFTREKQWINEQHLELCRVPSPTFIEHLRAAWIAGQFKSYGCETQIDRAGNVLAFLEPIGKRPLVALTAHLDTVIAPKSRDEISVEPDGRFRGPGVADNGAGLAALLAMTRALKAGPPIA